MTESQKQQCNAEQDVEWCRPLKMFLIELALAWAGEAHGMELRGAGQWKLPKMRYKGASVRPQQLRLKRQEPVPSSFLLTHADFAYINPRVAGSSGNTHSHSSHYSPHQALIYFFIRCSCP